MRSLERVLIQYESFAFKKKSRQRHIQRGDIKTRGEAAMDTPRETNNLDNKHLEVFSAPEL